MIYGSQYNPCYAVQSDYKEYFLFLWFPRKQSVVCDKQTGIYFTIFSAISSSPFLAFCLQFPLSTSFVVWTT